jgi:hypothetical protein
MANPNQIIIRNSMNITLLNKRLVLILLSVALTAPLIAQHALNGTVSDQEGKALGYATVALLNPSDSILNYFGVTDNKGTFKIKNIKEGDYLLQYSFVGMETLSKNISIPAPGGEDLGTQVLAPNALEEVTIIEEYIPITFKSDTVEFNPNAFNTKSHAVVEDLLKKMPGIEVDEAGNIKALGEDVVNVMVDGKEFFGKDPKVATKNLPADAIMKVQVYDKKSDESEFTGVDDGVRERTINLMLNEDHKKGYFGNVEAGMGTDTRYSADGKIYRFSEKLQSALLGMANNINEFGYTGNHGKEWGARVEGENQSLAGGLNLSYNAEGTNRYFLSYLASTNNKEMEEETTTENYLTNGTYYQHSLVNVEERNTPHKLNLGVRHKFNEQHNLILDGDLSISSNNLFSEGLTNTGIEDALINTLNNTTTTESSVIDAETKGSYVFKFNEGRTQFKTTFSSYYHQDNSLLNWRDTINLYGPDSMDLFVQFRDEYTDRAGLVVIPGVLQRIKQFWYLSAGVELGIKTERLDWQQEIERGSGESRDTIFPSFSTQELSVGPMLSLKRNSNKSQIEFILKGTWNQLDKMLDEVSLEKPSYFYFQPGFNYEYKYRTGRRINVRYSTNVNMPSANQLYPVANTLNLLSIYQGNLKLTPEYSHNLSASWWYFDQFSFTSLFARLGAGYVKDKIGWSQYTNEELITLVSPVNTPDHRSVYSYISFSTPIRALGMKVNLTSHENWSKGLSIINGEDNTQSNFLHSFSLRFENRKKEKWDAALGSNVSITDARFSISSMNTVYYNTSLYTDIRFTPSDKWSFETLASVVNYNSKSFDEAVSIPLLTAGISYYFLRGERASLTLRGYDLLNKQVGFERISQTNYLMQREWNTIGRYVMLEFHMRIGR